VDSMIVNHEPGRKRGSSAPSLRHSFAALKPRALEFLDMVGLRERRIICRIS